MNDPVEKGDIYWVDIPKSQTVGTEQWKRRPYIIVSRTLINKLGRNVVGVPMSTEIRKASQHRILIPVSEITKDVSCTDTLSNSVAPTDQIRVLDTARLERKIGKLSQTAIIALELGLAFLFDIR